MQTKAKNETRSERRSYWHWTFRIRFALSRRRIYFGIPTAVFLPDREELTITLPKIEKALRLIANYDPLRLARLQRNVERILVCALPGSLGRWVDSLQMCVIDVNYACSASAPEIASLLVHEATHARLCRLGFGYTEPIRDRIERICIRAEISFAERLPDGESLIAEAESNLARPATDWTNTAIRDRELEWLDRSGLPSWFTRWVRSRVER